MKILDILSEANGAQDSTKESRAAKAQEGWSKVTKKGDRKSGDLSATGTSENKAQKAAAAATKAEAARTDAQRKKTPKDTFIRNFTKNADLTTTEKRNTVVSAGVSKGTAADGVDSTPTSRKAAKSKNPNEARAANDEVKAAGKKKTAEKAAKEAGEDKEEAKEDRKAEAKTPVSLANVGGSKFKSSDKNASK